MRELLSRPDISSTQDVLVLQYATSSILLWCCVPLAAAAMGAAGLLFVRYHNQRADPPSPSAVPMTIFSICTVIFAIILSVALVPAVARTEICVTPTEVTQDVGLWWDNRLRRFAYEDIKTIAVTTEMGDIGAEPVWKIAWRNGESEAFNPGDLWSANQQLIRERMEQHGVRFAEVNDDQ
jgi:hypothetical protein